MSTQFVSAKSVGAYINATKGSVVTEVLGSGMTEDGRLLPIVSENEEAKGKPYYIICFEDGCRFNLTCGALNYYCKPVFNDGTKNPKYIGKTTIDAGDKLAMFRDESGMPVVKKVK